MATYKFWFFILTLSIVPVGITRAQEVVLSDIPITLDCLFKEATDNQGIYELVSGKPIVLVCTVQSYSKENGRGMILVKQMGPVAAVSTAEIAIAAGARVDATLELPALYQNGEYSYTVSFTDTGGGTLHTQERVFQAVLKAPERPRIGEVVINPNMLAWSAVAELTISLDYPQGMDLAGTDQWFLQAALLNQTGGLCQSLLDDQSFSFDRPTYKITWPGIEKHCANTLSIALLDSEKQIIDQKFMALSLPLSEAVRQPIDQSVIFSFLRSNIWLVVSCLFGIGLLATLWLVRRRASENGIRGASK